MKKYYAIISENVYVTADIEQDAVTKIKKHYDKLGLFNVDIKIINELNSNYIKGSK